MNAELPLIFHKKTSYDLRAFRDLPTPLSIPVSAGRSSGMLACLIAEANGGIPKGAVLNFQNTSLEDEESYLFLDRLERHLGTGILRLEYNPDAPNKYDVVGHNSMHRDGEVFERLLTQILKRRDGTMGIRPLPNPAQRVCTAQLKTQTAHRYFRRELGWPTKYYTTLGYRYDERARVMRRRKLNAGKKLPEGGLGIFPLFDAKITSDDVHWFWRRMPFDLGIDSNMGNCDLCFMKSEWKLKETILLHPKRAERWARWEERAAATDRPSVFRDDRPCYRELINQVRAGNMEGSKKGDRCRSCSD